MNKKASKIGGGKEVKQKRKDPNARLAVGSFTQGLLRRKYEILILTLVVFTLYMACFYSSFEQAFFYICVKVGVSSGAHALSKWIGCSLPSVVGGILTASLGHMMFPAGEGTSGARSPLPGGSSSSESAHSWIDRLISSPPQSAGAPPAPGQPPAEGMDPVDPSAPVIPERQPPLMAENLRLRELMRSLSLRWIGRNTWRDYTQLIDMVYIQALIETRVQDALVDDGYPPHSLFLRRGDIRDVLFYRTDGEALSRATLHRYVGQINSLGTRESIPYRKVARAIRDVNILL